MLLRPLSKSPVEQEEPVDLHLGTAKPLSKIASWGPPPDGGKTGEAVMGDEDVGDAVDGESVGFAVGNAVGFFDGAVVGLEVTGALVGLLVGLAVRTGVGFIVGGNVGFLDGEFVGFFDCWKLSFL